MISLYDRFQRLSPNQKRTVHQLLCQHALLVWNDYMSASGPLTYYDSSVGLQYEVDATLPQDAMSAVFIGVEIEDVARRYQEPISALQAMDLRLPRHITFAYYAIYNLFEKYGRLQPVESWLIVNQALSAEVSESKWEQLFMDALNRSG